MKKNIFVTTTISQNTINTNYNLEATRYTPTTTTHTISDGYMDQATLDIRNNYKHNNFLRKQSECDRIIKEEQ